MYTVRFIMTVTPSFFGFYYVAFHDQTVWRCIEINNHELLQWAGWLYEFKRGCGGGSGPRTKQESCPDAKLPEILGSRNFEYSK